MTDRELLEAAAGVFGVPACEEGGYLYACPGEISTTGWGIVTWCGLGSVQYWNPLESNDDAFRLAVKLRISFNIMPARGCYMVTAEAFGGPNVEAWSSGWEDCDQATRLAITRAAASMATQEKAE